MCIYCFNNACHFLFTKKSTDNRLIYLPIFVTDSRFPLRNCGVVANELRRVGILPCGFVNDALKLLLRCNESV